MAEELKPCPFCGEDAEVDTRQAFRHYRTGEPLEQVAVFCTGCCANISWYPGDLNSDRDATEEFCITAWNTRPSTPPAVSDDLVEEIVRALAKADGLDWDEECGLECTDPDTGECDSGTCVAAHMEDHDPDFARTIYLRRAEALAALIHPREQQAAEAMRERCAVAAETWGYSPPPAEQVGTPRPEGVAFWGITVDNRFGNEKHIAEAIRALPTQGDESLRTLSDLIDPQVLQAMKTVSAAFNIGVEELPAVIAAGKEVLA